MLLSEYMKLNLPRVFKASFLEAYICEIGVYLCGGVKFYITRF